MRQGACLAQIDQSDTPSLEYAELKTEHTGRKPILVAELGRDGGVVLMSRCLELPSVYLRVHLSFQ